MQREGRLEEVVRRCREALEEGACCCCCHLVLAVLWLLANFVVASVVGAAFQLCRFGRFFALLCFALRGQAKKLDADLEIDLQAAYLTPALTLLHFTFRCCRVSLDDFLKRGSFLGARRIMFGHSV